MGTELLVASLWGVVLVYWFWSRRPTTADTVGLFHRELRVLEDATPARVAPANRRCAYDPAAAPGPMVVPTGCLKRTEVRRRRRDVLSVLCALVVLSLAVALVTRAPVAMGSQVLCDLVLVAYGSLLVRAARSPSASGARARSAAYTLSAASPRPAAPEASPTWVAPPRRRPQPAVTSSYVPAHASRRAVRRAATGPDAESYGDFESYASLALASAN